jgi:hypothetical protein
LLSFSAVEIAVSINSCASSKLFTTAYYQTKKLASNKSQIKATIVSWSSDDWLDRGSIVQHCLEPLNVRSDLKPEPDTLVVGKNSQIKPKAKIC